MNEIVLHQSSITEQMEFARAVVAKPEGGARSLLPESYRDNPGNVLIAVGLGQSMGLSPAESLYRIDVIQGKPTAGAELIAANVRKAGHKLRVRVSENPPAATCTIIRADDPDEPTTVTRDMEWARQMGLTSKDNYKKQPATMLSWRAISACARLACPEALYGVSYTPDEMRDLDDRPARPAVTTQPASGADRMGAILGSTTTAEQVTEPVETSESRPLNTSGTLARRMFAVMGDAGITERDARLEYASQLLGREITSSKDLTEADAETIIDATQAALDEPFEVQA